MGFNSALKGLNTLLLGSHDTLSVATRLLAGARNLSTPHKAQTISGAHLSSLSMGTDVLSWQ